MARSSKIPLIVVCGSSVEEGRPMFWALDTSDSRLFLVRESTRVDVVADMLYDFIGKDISADIDFKLSVISKRGEQLVGYILKRKAKYEEAGQLEEVY